LARSIFDLVLASKLVVMAKSDPTKDPEFQRVLSNLLKSPPKLHTDMKLGKRSSKKARNPVKRGASAKPKT
jgi:hypothetical protein